MKYFKRKYSQTFFKQLVAFLRRESGNKDLESAYHFTGYEYIFEDIFQISDTPGDWWWPTLNDIYLALPVLRPTPVQSTQMGRNTVSPVKTTNRRRI